MTPGGRLARRRAAVPVLAGGLLLAAGWTSASAQEAVWPGRLTIEAGVGVAGGHRVGSSEATLTSNLTPRGEPFTLFAADVRLEAARAVGARVGWQITSSWSVEGEFAYSDNPVRVSIGRDAAGTPARGEVGGRLAQFAVGGSVRIHPERLQFGGGRARPFLLAGGSYLRQLHAGRTLLEEGRLYRAGGGLTWLLVARPQGRIKGLALRTDARWRLRTAGFELEGRRRSSVAGTAGLQVRF